MSSFRKIMRHPVTGMLKIATYMDNYFSEHEYGIKFDGEDKVYTKDEVAKEDSDDSNPKPSVEWPEKHGCIGNLNGNTSMEFPQPADDIMLG